MNKFEESENARKSCYSSCATFDNPLNLESEASKLTNPEILFDIKDSTINAKHLNTIDFNWISNKCSNLGRIENAKELVKLYCGKYIEDQ
jgi:hypothetical protein